MSDLLLLDFLDVCVLGVDRQARLVYMNQSAEMFFQVSFRQATAQPLSDLGPCRAALQNAIARCAETGATYRAHELRLPLGNELFATVDLTVTPVPDDSRHGPLSLIEMIPLDQRLQMAHEEHIHSQQKTSRMLFRNLAHEVKNPLGGLRGAAQLLQAELDSDELREYTQVIIAEADRLRNLVDRLLGPNQPANFQPVNIHRVLERVRALLEAELSGQAAIVIEQDFDPSIPDLVGDYEQLIQALLNMVGNSIQAIRAQTGTDADASGKICLRTRIRRQYPIGPSRHRLVLAVEVADNGPGVPEDLADRIFFPTITGYSDGTGLGLSIAQNIAEQHGGLIEFRSAPGDTVFTLLLPLQKEQ